MLKITINDTQTYQYRKQGDIHLINDTPTDWDIVQLSERSYHIIYKGKTYQAELLTEQEGKNVLEISINQKTVKVEIKDQLSQMLDQLGIKEANSQKIDFLKSPMPGLILKIEKNEGEAFKKGEALIILEAMKMENTIKAQADGVVKKINISKGDTVEKNQVLMEFK